MHSQLQTRASGRALGNRFAPAKYDATPRSGGRGEDDDDKERERVRKTEEGRERKGKGKKEAILSSKAMASAIAAWGSQIDLHRKEVHVHTMVHIVVTHRLWVARLRDLHRARVPWSTNDEFHFTHPHRGGTAAAPLCDVTAPLVLDLVHHLRAWPKTRHTQKEKKDSRRVYQGYTWIVRLGTTCASDQEALLKGLGIVGHQSGKLFLEYPALPSMIDDQRSRASGGL